MILVDVGDFAAIPTNRGKIKTRTAVRAMNAMGYDAMTLGERELILGDEFFKKEILDCGVDLILTNARSNGNSLGKKYLILKRGGVKIGLVGLLDNFPAFPDKVTDPFGELGKVIDEVEKKSDIVVVLSHLGYLKSVELAEKFPQLDVIVVGHGGQRTYKPIEVGNTILVQNGDQGKYLGRLDLGLDKEKNLTSFDGSLVALGRQITDNPDLAQIYNECQQELKGLVTKVKKSDH